LSHILDKDKEQKLVKDREEDEVDIEEAPSKLLTLIEKLGARRV
jgi:hypothetical protein